MERTNTGAINAAGSSIEGGWGEDEPKEGRERSKNGAWTEGEKQVARWWISICPAFSSRRAKRPSQRGGSWLSLACVEIDRSSSHAEPSRGDPSVSLSPNKGERAKGSQSEQRLLRGGQRRSFDFFDSEWMRTSAQLCASAARLQEVQQRGAAAPCPSAIRRA